MGYNVCRLVFVSRPCICILIPSFYLQILITETRGASLAVLATCTRVQTCFIFTRQYRFREPGEPTSVHDTKSYCSFQPAELLNNRLTRLSFLAAKIIRRIIHARWRSAFLFFNSSFRETTEEKPSHSTWITLSIIILNNFQCSQ